MIVTRNDYSITDESDAVDITAVGRLLSNTYWAENRPLATIKKSIEHSVCFTLRHSDMQIGFARIVTDCATFGYLADVVIEEQHRGKGLGVWFVETILTDARWKDLFLVLGTLDAHGLYEKFGFTNSDRLMGRSPHL